MKDKFEWMIPATVVAIMLAIVAAAYLTLAYFEASSYRKFCNTPVTTWDALWLDLRIDECACEEMPPMEPDDNTEG